MKSNTQNFTEYLRFEKRFSPHTVSAYLMDLSQFEAYLLSQYDITKVKDISHSIIRSWVVQLMEEKISARSVNRKITTLKTFYRFLMREKKVKVNPMLKIQSPKTSKRLPVFVEKNGMDDLLEQMDFGDDFKGSQNKMIIEMFYGTGMRLAELINIMPADIDIGSMSVKVLGKRNKERIIPFSHTLKDAIIDFKQAREKEGLNDSVNFFSKRGKKMDRKLVYRIVKTYLSLVTTLDKKSPHVLRHTFATHMLNNGADLNAIKELLGHASLSATQVYTHNTIEKLKNVHKNAHPKA